jgi:hypothetical protein
MQKEPLILVIWNVLLCVRLHLSTAAAVYGIQMEMEIDNAWMDMLK